MPVFLATVLSKKVSIAGCSQFRGVQDKQYALDHDTTLTAIAIEAFEEFLQRKKKDKI